MSKANKEKRVVFKRSKVGGASVYKRKHIMGRLLDDTIAISRFFK